MTRIWFRDEVPFDHDMHQNKVTARISKETSPYVGERWICRLYEPGGNVWHGQVAHVSFNTDMTADQFAEECRRRTGVNFEVEV